MNTRHDMREGMREEEEYKVEVVRGKQLEDGEKRRGNRGGREESTMIGAEERTHYCTGRETHTLHGLVVSFPFPTTFRPPPYRVDIFCDTM